MGKVKAALTEVNSVVRQKLKNSKCLKTVQEPVYEFVNSGEEMVKTKEKNLAGGTAKPRAVANLIAAEKENAPALRRSKRKQSAAVEPVSYAESPEPESSISVKNVKSKAKKPAAKAKKPLPSAKKDSTINLNQTKLNFPQLPTIDEKFLKDSSDMKPAEPGKCSLGASFSSVVTEDSGYAPSAGTSSGLISDSIVVLNSPDVRSYPVSPITSENSILTCSSPPITYWMELAEQRQVALEKALQENEMLHDQLEVLVVENAQIKSLLREAEKMARILKGIMD